MGEMDTAAGLLSWITESQECIFTLMSRKTGCHYTYRTRRSKPVNRRDITDKRRRYVVSILAGPSPNSEKCWKFFGVVIDEPKFNRIRYVTVATSVTGFNPSAKFIRGFDWFFARLTQGRVPRSVQVSKAVMCKGCGRWLTDPVSIKLGYGPVCARKAGLVEENRGPALL